MDERRVTMGECVILWEHMKSVHIFGQKWLFLLPWNKWYLLQISNMTGGYVTWNKEGCLSWLISAVLWMLYILAECRHVYCMSECRSTMLVDKWHVCPVWIVMNNSVRYCRINYWSLTSEVCICKTSGKHLQLNLLLCTCTQDVIYSSVKNTQDLIWLLWNWWVSSGAQNCITVNVV